MEMYDDCAAPAITQDGRLTQLFHQLVNAREHADIIQSRLASRVDNLVGSPAKVQGTTIGAGEPCGPKTDGIVSMLETVVPSLHRSIERLEKQIARLEVL